MDNATKAQIENLQAQGQNVLVDFYATWCVPCQQLMPRLSNLEQNYKNVKFVKVDIDNNMEYAQSLNIMTVPTILIYKGTELVNKSIGANVDSVYQNILDTL
jgi:thioredoxin 1